MIMISQIDRDYGFDENDIIESNESFMEAMKDIENRKILNAAANELELLAQAIRDENKELFGDLVYETDGVHSVIIIPKVELDKVHSIIFQDE